MKYFFYCTVRDGQFLSLFCLPPFPCAKYFTAEKKEDQTSNYDTNTYLVQYHSMICCTYEPTADTQEPTASHTQNSTQKNWKHRHHVPPKPLASSGSNFTGECNRCTSRNRYWSPQYGNVTFIDKTNCSVILFTIILQATAWRARGQKVSFSKLLFMLFLHNCIGTMHTNLSYPAIFYLLIPHKY